MRTLSGRLSLSAALAVLPLAVVTPSPGSPSAERPARVAAAGPEVQPVVAANPDNPLAGRSWGVYKGDAEPVWPAYEQATGERKEKLATLALAPKAKLFGRWIPDGEIAGKVRDYVASSTAEDPRALVQMTLFRMQPWEQEICRRLPTAAERASYRTYVDRFARTLGESLGQATAAVVVQPDGPFADCAPRGSTLPSRMVRYAVRAIEAQPGTTTYIEMGSADWFRDRIGPAVRMLVRAGVADARGFALDWSHYDSTARQIRFGARIAAALERRGIPDRHLVIDTSDNGRPFTGEWWRKHHPAIDLGAATTCQTRSQRRCVTLGIPPTTDVAATRWGLPDRVARTAARLVDGYLWFGRPWLRHQKDGFVMQRALDVVRTTPYRQG